MSSANAWGLAGFAFAAAIALVSEVIIDKEPADTCRQDENGQVFLNGEALPDTMELGLGEIGDKVGVFESDKPESYGYRPVHKCILEP